MALGLIKGRIGVDIIWIFGFLIISSFQFLTRTIGFFKLVFNQQNFKKNDNDIEKKDEEHDSTIRRHLQWIINTEGEKDLKST